MNSEEQPDPDLLNAQEVQEMKDQLRPPRPEGKSRGCPDEERMRLAAAGVLPEADTEALMSHASTCMWCGRLVRETTEDFEDSSPTAEELALATGSHLANDENRRVFAERLAELSLTPPRPRPSVRWKAWSAVAALAACFGGLAIFLWPTSPEILLARAYTEYRPMDMRLAGARYGRVRTVREGGDLPINRSPDLHEAEARILREIETHPNDPHWLGLKGRAQLLRGKADEAIVELERARGLRPEDPYVLSDLGAAWFLKAQKTADQNAALKSYSSAFEFVSRAVRLKPADQTLQFNRALAAEHIYAYHEARDSWEAYLQLDSTSPWAGEARSHLADVKQKLERQRAYVEATTPDALIASLRRGPVRGQSDIPDEEYLKLAVTRLLPDYYGDRTIPDVVVLLRNLAGRFAVRHGDTWLRDVLKPPPSETAAAAFTMLGRSVIENGAGSLPSAYKEAEAAASVFRAAANGPGTAWAEYQRIAMLQQQARYPECAPAAATLGQSLRTHSYVWLRVQVSIEEGDCLEWTGDFAHARANYAGAVRVSQQSGYFGLFQRAVAFDAALWETLGNSNMSWKANTRGISQYWQASYPMLYAQTFYDSLSELAGKAGLAYAAVALATQNLDITIIAGRRNFQAAALHRRAMFDRQAGLKDAAMADLRESLRIISKFPPEQQGPFKLYTEIDLAALECEMGGLDRPLQRLLGFRKEVDSSPDALLKLRYYAALGKLRLRRGEYAESQTLLEQARMIAGNVNTPSSGAARPEWMRTVGDAYRALVECRIRAGVPPPQSWRFWSSYRNALFHGRAYDPPVALPAGEALLSFIELPSGVGVWIGTDRGFEFRMLDANIREIQDNAEELLRDCANERSSQPILRAAGQQLSRWLLGQWDNQLDGIRHLVIETDRPVAMLPWAVLVRSNGNYWSQDFAIRICEGSARANWPGESIASQENMLAVGAPAIASDADLAPLPDAVIEAKKVSGLFGRSLLLMDDKATLPAVREHLETANVFHFAGHGYGGEGGGLMLAGTAGQTAFLRSAEIESLDLSRCHLVVLSACATASGERSGPGDPESLVRAFLRAGSRDVVASLWNLSSAGTAAFMGDFYRELLSGAATAESLRLAGNAARSSKLYAHPFYWAGLELFSGN